ncbi:low-density lipoprotein receptor-related protein 4-like [Homalodisca vitripennis]|uniref:low-density lipoprotein receptor-related protein 4-like n=1 Tax=Homalodisca vitripennis TaxID=197043 RepID=UPI001EEA20FD|nr:low-density lipoprotein receptor-related protein 4-like [Homalodisca vitripennis]
MSAFLYSLLLLSSLALIKAVDQVNNGSWLLLLHNHAKQITLLDLESNLTQTVVATNQTIVTFDYHLAKNMLFWATNNRIYRCSLNKTQDSLTTQIAYAESVAGLSVDWVHDRVYWTDSATGQLEVAKLTGESRQVLYREGKPTSVIVDPFTSKVFWIDAHPHLPKVRYAWLDGTYPRRGRVWQAAPVLWEADRLAPHGPLALDIPRHQLYFTQVERSQTTVMAADYRDKKIKVVLNCWSMSPAMVLLEDRVYWSNSSGVYWTPGGSNEVNTISKQLKDIKQMKLVSSNLQLPDQDKCAENRCDQECYVVDDVASCGCRFGYSLLSDLTSCQDNGYAVIYSGDSIYRMTLSPEDSEPYSKIQLLYRNPATQISAAAVHVRLGLIVWSDYLNGKIFSASVDKPIVPKLIAKSMAKSLAVDWLQDHLYWTVDTRIHMSTMDGSMQAVVAEDPDKPLSIAVDPVNRRLFWSVCGWRMLIINASLTGWNRSEMVTKDISCATSLSLDNINQRLHWVDRTRGGSSSVYYDGLTRHNLHEPRIQSLTVFEDKELWIADHEQALFINKSSWITQIRLGFQPLGVVVFSRRAQLGGPDYCQDSACSGMCVPGIETGSWSCLCPKGMFLDEDNITCLSIQQQALTGFPHSGDAMQVIAYDSSSVTLDYDTIRRAENYIITLEAVSSYQSRDLESERMKISTNTFPVTINGLQPATTYSVVVESHPTYIGVWRIVVSTCPPPLQVTRLPQVYKPPKVPVRWLEDTQHVYDITYTWEPLVRQFYLLMFLQTHVVEMDEVHLNIRPRVLVNRIQESLADLNVTDKFFVIHHYENKEIFDRDTEMYLYNTPYDIEFFLAMVQVSQYSEAFSVDIVLSEKTLISSSSWK